jgi:hypothetical protein
MVRLFVFCTVLFVLENTVQNTFFSNLHFETLNGLP